MQKSFSSLPNHLSTACPQSIYLSACSCWAKTQPASYNEYSRASLSTDMMDGPSSLILIEFSLSAGRGAMQFTRFGCSFKAKIQRRVHRKKTRQSAFVHKPQKLCECVPENGPDPRLRGSSGKNALVADQRQNEEVSGISYSIFAQAIYKTI